MASLSSTLLARKGQAKPAMRPQGFASFGFGAPHQHDDLGWNDMGHDPSVEHIKREHGLGGAVEPIPASADIVPFTTKSSADLSVAAVPPVVHQQDYLARELAFAVTPRSLPGSKGKAAFTLRLDPDRHLRLRLTCAILHKSAQLVVTEALDAYLNSQPGVTDITRTATSK